MKYETAGDPMSDLKWTRKTTAKIVDELALIGILVSKTTVYQRRYQKERTDWKL